jgi:ParB family chromosome partitioning protein
MADEIRPRLGRGLAALIGNAGADLGSSEAPRAAQRKVPIEFLRPNPRNPRKQFDEEHLQELTDSIRARGLIQPIVVRAVPRMPDLYEIIAGERRWRAAQRAGVHDVPIHLVEASDQEALELAIVENIQRADLNPLEEAGGFDQLMRDFAYTQADLAKVLGKSRSHVANTLRLLNLPASLKAKVSAGLLSAGHARALLSVRDPEAVAALIIEKGLSVRDVERLAQEETEEVMPQLEHKSRGGAPVSKVSIEKDADTRALEKTLSDALGLVVEIDHSGESGELRIRYKTLEQLDGLCHRLNR